MRVELSPNALGIRAARGSMHNDNATFMPTALRAEIPALKAGKPPN
jgi:hypothetical protein